MADHGKALEAELQKLRMDVLTLSTAQVRVNSLLSLALVQAFAKDEDALATAQAAMAAATDLEEQTSVLVAELERALWRPVND